MTTDYDPIAEQYQRSKLQPWRSFIESFTLMELIGDPTGLSVIDIACGEGFYSRLIRRHGAAKVLGVDLSDGMIALARAQEQRQHLGVDYLVGDGRKLSLGANFDLAAAAYLLNYASTRDELRAMCEGVARCLKPGGRFVTVNCSPKLDFRTAPSYRQYGFEALLAGPFREGAPITWTFHLDDGDFDIENYYLDAATHEEAFRSADFSEIRWHAPRLSPDGAATFDQGFWSTFLDNSPIVFIECLK